MARSKAFSANRHSAHRQQAVGEAQALGGINLIDVKVGDSDLNKWNTCLSDLRMVGGLVDATHVRLAHELGSAREVVSRVLEDLKHHGLVALERGHITIRDWQGLREHHDQVAGSVGSFQIGQTVHGKKQ